jgi:HPt (histidine-containing phosphotransfer) domain-containing protein
MGAKPRKPEAIARPHATGEALAEPWIAERHAGEPAGAVAPVFSVEEALASVAGETDLLRQMAGYFFDEAPLQLAKMQEGLERNDAAAIARAAHRLRGTVIYLGAEGVLQNLEQLEGAGGAADLGRAAGLIADLAGKNSALSQALTSYLADEDDAQPA